MLRQGSQSSVDLRGPAGRRFPVEPPGRDYGSVPREFMRVVVQQLDDGVAPDAVQSLALL